MNKYMKDIVAFHEKNDLAVEQTPRHVSDEVSQFRFKFGLEELEEYQEAHYDMDLEGVLDSLVDQLYIIMGTAYQHGMAHVFDEAWDRVHTANMQKRRAQDPSESKRGSLLDVIKPEGWVAPVLKDLVKAK